MLVVRGATSAEPDTSIRQALLYRRRFPALGRFGLSAYSAPTDADVTELARHHLVAFATLRVYRAADLSDADFQLVPTYRSPHVTIAFYADVAVGVARLLAVTHRELRNPFVPDEETP